MRSLIFPARVSSRFHQLQKLFWGLPHRLTHHKTIHSQLMALDTASSTASVGAQLIELPTKSLPQTTTSPSPPLAAVQHFTNPYGHGSAEVFSLKSSSPPPPVISRKPPAPESPSTMTRVFPNTSRQQLQFGVEQQPSRTQSNQQSHEWGVKRCLIDQANWNGVRSYQSESGIETPQQTCPKQGGPV